MGDNGSPEDEDPGTELETYRQRAWHNAPTRGAAGNRTPSATLGAARVSGRACGFDFARTPSHTPSRPRWLWTVVDEHPPALLPCPNANLTLRGYRVHRRCGSRSLNERLGSTDAPAGRPRSYWNGRGYNNG